MRPSAAVVNLWPCHLHQTTHTHTVTEYTRIFIHTALAAINPELTKTKPHDSMFVRGEHTHALCGGEVFTDQFGPIRQSLASTHNHTHTHPNTHLHTEPVLPVALGEPL